MSHHLDKTNDSPQLENYQGMLSSQKCKPFLCLVSRATIFQGYYNLALDIDGILFHETTICTSQRLRSATHQELARRRSCLRSIIILHSAGTVIFWRHFFRVLLSLPYQPTHRSILQGLERERLDHISQTHKVQMVL